MFTCRVEARERGAVSVLARNGTTWGKVRPKSTRHFGQTTKGTTHLVVVQEGLVDVLPLLETVDNLVVGTASRRETRNR